MATDRLTACDDRVLCTRIIGEFLEMPGLTLTLAQACRLWAIEQSRCVRTLETLCASGFLHRVGDRYARAEGRCRAA